VVGDQDPFAEDVLFQCLSFGVVDGPGRSAVGGALPGQFPVDDGVDPGTVVIFSISVLSWSRVVRVFPRANVALGPANK